MAPTTTNNPSQPGPQAAQPRQAAPSRAQAAQPARVPAGRLVAFLTATAPANPQPEAPASMAGQAGKAQGPPALVYDLTLTVRLPAGQALAHFMRQVSTQGTVDLDLMAAPVDGADHLGA